MIYYICFVDGRTHEKPPVSGLKAAFTFGGVWRRFFFVQRTIIKINNPAQFDKGNFLEKSS